MRLSELRPEWHDADPDQAWLYFDCPHCRSHHLIQIPVIKGEPNSQGTHSWGWNGETDFEKITLHPSINCQGHWHGFVKSGEITFV